MIERDVDTTDHAVLAAKAAIVKKFSPENGRWSELDVDRILYVIGWPDDMTNARVIEMALEALDKGS